jgi:hypothetical protein
MEEVLKQKLCNSEIKEVNTSVSSSTKHIVFDRKNIIHIEHHGAKA